MVLFGGWPNDSESDVCGCRPIRWSADQSAQFPTAVLQHGDDLRLSERGHPTDLMARVRVGQEVLDAQAVPKLSFCGRVSDCRHEGLLPDCEIGRASCRERV